MSMKKLLFISMVGVALLVGFGLKGPSMKRVTVISSAFDNNGAIPKEYTCQGADDLPELTINDIPATAKTLTIIVDDPDAPNSTWVHWVVFNIPASMNHLPRNVHKTGVLEQEGAVQATTSWKKTSWGGPCPPTGNHRYYFKIYALDTS